MTDRDDRRVDLVERRRLLDSYFKVDVLRLRHTLYRGGLGAEIKREILCRGDAVAVLLYDPERDALVLIEQFRVGPYLAGDDPWMLEVVAGLIEEGETREDVARREVLEEAGLIVERLEFMLQVYTSPGAVSERIAIYYAEVDAAHAGGVHGVEEEGEDIKVVVLPFEDAMAALQQGRITAGPAVVAVQWLALNRDRLRMAASK